MPRYYATEPAPDDPNAEEAEGHMPLKRGATDHSPDETGMGPDEAGKFKYATEPKPDEPGAEEAEGHIRGRASEPAPDEPGADMDPDASARVKF